MNRINKYTVLIILFHLFVLHVFDCYGKNVTLTKVTTKGVEKFVVDSTINELFFSKDYTVKILGLENLINLKKISFEKTAFIKNFEFITDNTGIEILIIAECEVQDFEFLKKMPNLKELVLQACKANYNNLDLKNNRNIEYVEITNSQLVTLPNIKNTPTSLKYVNLSFNNISTIRKNDFVSSNVIIFIYQNPISNFLPNYEYEINMLPDKYKKYIR